MTAARQLLFSALYRLLTVSILVPCWMTPTARAEPAVAPDDQAPVPQMKVTADDRGFRFGATGDPPSFEIALQALMQADGRFFLGNSDDAAHNNFLLRRMRPRISGTIYGLVYFKIVTDFGGGDVVLTDAMVDVRPYKWLRLTGGKFQPPLGLERLQSDATLPMVEAAVDSNLAVSRDVGAMLWGELADGMLLYQVAVANGAPDGVKQDLDNGRHKDVYGRLLLRPFSSNPDLGVLGIGLGASAGIRDGTTGDTSLSNYKTPGQNRLFGYATSKDHPEDNTYASGWHTRLNPQLFYYYRGLGLLAEMIQSRQEVHRDGYTGTLLHRGWHVTMSYVLGGSNGYDGAVADHPWEPSEGHYGALEIVARYGQLVLDPRTFPTFADPSKSARGGTTIGVAMNWILGRLFRVVLGLERMQIQGGAGSPDAVQDRSPEYVMVTRLTLNL